MNISASDLFAALAHDTRLRCLVLLMHHKELCVCQLTDSIGASQPHMSRHLARLRELGLVCDRRKGIWIHYRVNADLPEWVKDVLQTIAEGVAKETPFMQDAAALAGVTERPPEQRCVSGG